MGEMLDRKHCSGCRNDYYNDGEHKWGDWDGRGLRLCLTCGEDETWDEIISNLRTALASAVKERDEWRELADRCEDVSELKDKLATAMRALENYACHVGRNGETARRALAEIRGTSE